MARSNQHVTRTYVTALGLTASLAVASHLTLDRVISAHDGSASVINVSGRQRMLSQRMALDAALYVLGDDLPAREALARATERFETVHRRLSGDAALSPETKALYFGPAPGVDGMVREYVGLAHTVADPVRSPADPVTRAAFARLSALAQGPVVESLDAIVSRHELESTAQLGRLRRLQTLLSAILLSTLLGEALLVFRPMARRVRQYAAELMSLAGADPLTGAFNRRSFDERGAVEVARAHRYHHALSVLMLDGDRFKQINDRHGHAAGDEALQSLVRTVGGLLRPSDVLGRIGGEEFAVLLPETPLEGAVEVARRICRVMAETTVSHEGASFGFTVSIGAATLDPGDVGLDAVVGRADAALYRAKQGGRNRVATLAEPVPPHLEPPHLEPIVA